MRRAFQHALDFGVGFLLALAVGALLWALYNVGAWCYGYAGDWFVVVAIAGVFGVGFAMWCEDERRASYRRTLPPPPPGWRRP